jgi:hypothetical protein
MRTKTLLLAVAALAAGISYSEAQNVYSQNIVGYVNVVIAGGGNYTLIDNPLDNGNGNSATNMLNNLPKNSSISLWDNPSQSFLNVITKGPSVWSGDFPIPPGTAVFVKNGGAASPAITNTFVGSINVPITNSITLPANYSMLGSYVPYSTSDATTDTNINLANLPKNSILETWDVPSQSFLTVATKGPSSWSTTVPLSVGQGMFIFVKQATNVWTETLTQ